MAPVGPCVGGRSMKSDSKRVFECCVRATQWKLDIHALISHLRSSYGKLVASDAINEIEWENNDFVNGQIELQSPSRVDDVPNAHYAVLIYLHEFIVMALISMGKMALKISV